jgi:hypothetical protein
VSERDQSQRRPVGESTSSWDQEAVGKSLNSEAGAVGDVAFGEGYSYHVGEQHVTCVEIFPQAQTVRLTTHAARIELFRQGPPTLTQEGVIFSQEYEQQSLHLTLSSTGEVSLALTLAPSSNAVEQSVITMASFEGIKEPLTGEQPLSGHSAPFTGHLEQQSTAPVDQEQTADEKQQRITLTGRVGKVPHLRTTKGGKTIATFPVAVHQEDGSTTWHTVVAFDERAQKLHETLTKGQSVQVIGYLHEREAKTKGGQPKIVQEVYAAVVKQR